MSVTSITSKNSALLQELTGKQTSGAGTASATQAAKTAAGQNSAAAYQLSLGKQQANQTIIGYGQLGKLVREAGSKVDDVIRQDLRYGLVSDGNGKLPYRTVSVEVRQFALGQMLTSGSLPDSDKTVLGTGKLTVTAEDGTSYDIEIEDGTLDGIAKTINDAHLGITAKVVLGEDGQYSLELTGPTGAKNSFTLSGIDKLAYDPGAKDGANAMTLAQSPANSIFAIDGGELETGPTNQIVTDDGYPITLKELGSSKVKVPVGFNHVAEASETLASTLNDLMFSIDTLTASGGALASSGDTARGLKKQTLAALQQSFAGSSLSDVGIAEQANGLLSVDQTKLQAAYEKNPFALRTLLANFAGAVHDALVVSGEGSITKQVETFTGQLTQNLSLMDFLNMDGGKSNATGFTGSLQMSGGGGLGDDMSSLLLSNFNQSLGLRAS